MYTKAVYKLILPEYILKMTYHMTIQKESKSHILNLLHQLIIGNSMTL